MHDLNQIIKANEDAFQRSVQTARAKGLTVVARYEGLHLVGFDSFRNPVDATRHLDSERNASRNQGASFSILPPLSDAEAALVRGRDQSEDYAGRA